MSKDLPYFKFFPGQWTAGDITLESMEIQGVFINVCATYWSKECKIEIAKLKHRYGPAIDTLLNSSLLKENSGFAVIEFLNEQWAELSTNHEINSKNGQKGAEKRWGKNGEANSPPMALRKEEIREDKKREEKILPADSLVLTLDQFEKEIRNSYKQLEAAARRNKTTPDKIIALIPDFIDTCRLKDKTNETFKEFCNYFSNWLLTEFSKNKDKVPVSITAPAKPASRYTEEQLNEMARKHDALIAKRAAEMKPVEPSAPIKGLGDRMKQNLGV